MAKSAEKIISDPEIGDVVLRKSKRSRSISIRVHPVRGVSVSVPYMVPYAVAMGFFKLKRDWVIQTVARQNEKYANVPKADPAQIERMRKQAKAELPARREEVHHAKEEGIEFRMLTNPTQVIGDDKGWVTGLSCVEMELGEPDESGRRSPVVKEGSDFIIECDVVIMALGTSPNPLLKSTTKGLETNRRGCIVADENGATTREGVFAGGDAVTGAATVILAMGAGRKAAKAIDEYIKSK